MTPRWHGADHGSDAPEAEAPDTYLDLVGAGPCPGVSRLSFVRKDRRAIGKVSVIMGRTPDGNGLRLTFLQPNEHVGEPKRSSGWRFPTADQLLAREVVEDGEGRRRRGDVVPLAAERVAHL
jgi:hypothetical protein